MSKQHNNQNQPAHQPAAQQQPPQQQPPQQHQQQLQPQPPQQSPQLPRSVSPTFVITHHPNFASAQAHWKMQEHFKTASTSLTQLQQLFHEKKVDTTKAQDLIRKLKLELVNFHLVPPFHEDKAIAEAQLSIARGTFEYATLLSTLTDDHEAFSRNVIQLKPYYYDFSALLKHSEHQWTILGLNLLSLLAANNLSDFHTELELIPAQQHENKHIHFPVKLEQYLMEGSYNKVLNSTKDVPSHYYSVFMTVLADTVREKIAQCAEKAYDSMSAADAKALLTLKSDAEAREYAEKHKWKLQDGKLHFPKGKDSSLDIPSHHVMQQALKYATELERIV